MAAKLESARSCHKSPTIEGGMVQTMRYEIFPEGNAWKWRLVAKDGAVLACAPRPLTRDQCTKAVRIMQITMDAPVVVLHEAR